MDDGIRCFIRHADGFGSQEAASFFAQMEDQSARLRESLRGISTAELEWQPAPGMNTIGMLLAHIAIGEVLWAQRALLGLEMDIQGVLGLARADDGMPLAPDGEPPAALRGRTLAEYEATLAKARACWRAAAAQLSDADLDREITLTRRDGQATMNLRWVLYHVLEHFAGHYGQILLLRHLRAGWARPSAR
jgi:uncharacterized damage-inducible protein DinB